jgi:hypothetical protein
MAIKGPLDDLDQSALFSGFRLGLFAGAIVALFKAPRIRIFRLASLDRLQQMGSDVRDRIESVIPQDTISRSLDEGKEVARRQRAALNSLRRRD